MLNFAKKLLGRLQLPENLLTIKDLLENDRRDAILEEQYLPQTDQQLLQSIRFRTSQLNVNNLTRTKAYLDFYLAHPEIHWAFLGHMVSRNGGWNMTDLQGEFLTRLMNEQSKQDFFSFLERGNWLIFHDAYPQFLLYEESLHRNANLFYLLPYLNVSYFMEVIWNYFLKEQDTYILAIALIINEQSYLEKRIVQNPHYQEKIFQTLEFTMQDLLSFNQILFPFSSNGNPIEKASLIGMTLHQFGSLHERIMLGKDLYRLLFHDEEQFEKVFRWASSHPHSASRKDYWPDVFNDIYETVPRKTMLQRFTSCRLKEGAPRLYSPKLSYAWADVTHPPAEQGDWFEDWRVIHYLKQDNGHKNGNIMEEYCETLERLELAAIAKKAIST